MKIISLVLTFSTIFLSPNFLHAAFFNDHSTDRKTLDSVSYDRDNTGQIIGLIAFTDGSIWSWRRNPFYEDNVYAWEPGDKIYLERSRKGDYSSYTVGLWNSSRLHEHFDFYDPEYIKVTITPESREYFTKVIEIEMDNERKMTLSDGTRWRVNWYNSLFAKDWEVGDLVIVGSKGLIFDSYELINLSQPSKYLSSEIDAYFVED